MDEDIKNIWDESKLEHEAIKRIGEGNQAQAEEVIANLAALQLLGEDPLDELVKNS